MSEHVLPELVPIVMSYLGPRMVYCGHRVEARMVTTFDDEVQLGLDVLEVYWGKHGYWSDDWYCAWIEMDISDEAKDEAWNRY